MELSKELQEIFKYKKVVFSGWKNEAVYAYVTKDNWVKFFIAYEDDIDGSGGLQYIQRGFDSIDVQENCNELIEEHAIIDGSFAITENQNHKPVLYLDTDLSKRTPPREYLDDWVTRFGMIHNFVNEYHWLTRDLYKEV